MTTAFGQGLQAIVESQLQAYSSPNVVQVRVSSGNSAAPGTIPAYQPGRLSANERQLTLSQNDIKTIKNVPGASEVYAGESATPDYIQYGAGKYVISLDSLYPGDQIGLVAGNIPSPGSHEILLPYPYIATFGASQASDLIGKSISLHLTSQVNPSQQEDVNFTVKGIMPDTVHVPNALVPADTLNTLAQFQNPNPTFTSIAIVTNGSLTPAQNTSLKNALAAKGYDSQTYQDIQNNFKRPLQIIQYGLDGFAAIALLAAAIGIINTLLMAVLERTQEVGLMKALGMRRRGIFTLFISEALGIGFWGGVIGVGIAAILGSVANSILVKGIFKGIAFKHLLVFPLPYMAAIIIGAMLLGAIAGTLPALRASRLDPIDALRRE